MAAYNAARSLMNAIQRIRLSSRISLVSGSPEMLDPAYEELDRLQTLLGKLDETGYSKIRTEVNVLDEEIKEAVWKFEDLLESHLSHQILPQLSGDHHFSVELQSLQHHVDYFVKMLKKMEEEYINKMENMPEEQGQPISSRIDFGGIESKVVGLTGEFVKAMSYLLAENERNCCYALVGMVGVGKTTLAKKIFVHELIKFEFELRAWVKVGRKYESNEILRCILTQVDPNTCEKRFAQGEDEERLVEYLKEVGLKGKRCLIVLDDVWDLEATDRLINSLQDKNLGRTRFLLTSRIRDTDMTSSINYGYVRLLSKEESKELLCQRVFGDESFPPQLEELGEEIANKCEGLPLMIVKVAELLSKADKTPEYWKQAAKQHSSLFLDAYDQISEVLFPSYEYLPQRLKMYFLYMGAFPSLEILPQKLLNLFTAEGFHEACRIHSFEIHFREWLLQLGQSYHLILLKPNTSHPSAKVKWCRVHSCWQHVCKKESSRIKFLHVLQSYDDVMKDKRRLCVHWNSLLGFRQVYDSIKRDCASTARSLLCLGPYHQYPVPIHAMGFKLLRVLNALTLRFYHFPIEILKLVYLHYLALTCNGELPTSISILFHLQFLFIHPHINIRKRGAQSYMPVQIWDMQELQHIEILGSDLPSPNSDEATLNKLFKLIGVSAKTCTREVLRRIPKLKKLGIQVELKPYDDDPLSDLGHISELQNLEVLKYCIMNPEMKYATPLIPLPAFPSTLRKLHFSGLGYSWEYMNEIGALLPNLQVLKLRCCAFRGPEWIIETGLFLKVETLVIEDTDLVRWKPQPDSFIQLKNLSIRHCYKLQELDWPADRRWNTKVKLVDCNPLAEDCAYRVRPPSPSAIIVVRSSF